MHPTNYTNNVDCGSDPVRQPIASNVVALGQSMAKRAQSLAERVNGKLQSVMNNDASPPCESTKMDEYPPLFADLRASLRSIEDALNSIDDSISRTEL